MRRNPGLSNLPKIVLGALALTSAVSCAVPQSGSQPDGGPAVSTASGRSGGSGSLDAAFGAYSSRDFGSAAESFAAASSNNDTAVAQVAFLGAALVHLSTDDAWRNVDSAALNLQSAESLGAPASTEIGLLMSAVGSLIGVEADISALNTRANNSAAELGRLKEQRQSLEQEIAKLNEALEKLKELTIGN